MAYIAFNGCDNPDLDVDGAAAALREAGYTVHRMPEKYRRYLQLPLDDHMEAVTAAPDGYESEVEEEVRAIADRFGGDCIGCDPIGPEYKPFVELLKDTPEFVP
jgi:hypothetical protein